jgi:hypothetical protein
MTRKWAHSHDSVHFVRLAWIGYASWCGFYQPQMWLSNENMKGSVNCLSMLSTKSQVQVVADYGNSKNMQLRQFKIKWNFQAQFYKKKIYKLDSIITYKKTYIINVEIHISIRYNLPLRINSMSLVLVCHQDSPVRCNSSKLKTSFPVIQSLNEISPQNKILTLELVHQLPCN